MRRTDYRIRSLARRSNAGTLYPHLMVLSPTSTLRWFYHHREGFSRHLPHS